MELTSYKALFWLLLLLPLLAAFGFSMVKRPKIGKYASFILTAASLAALALALCRPFIGLKSDDTHYVFLMDVSDSIDKAAADNGLASLKKSIESLPKGDSYDIYLFANSLIKTDLDKIDSEIKNLYNPTYAGDFRKNTDIEEAVSFARLRFPDAKGRRIVIFSDAIETKGNTEHLAGTLKKEKTELFLYPLKIFSEAEAAVLSLESNRDSVYKGEVLRLTAKLAANQDMNAKLRFLNDGVLIREMPVSLKKNSVTEISSDFQAAEEHKKHWQVELLPEKDHFRGNNSAARIIDVKGKPRVLLIHKQAAKLRPFASALREQNIDVELRGKFGIPENMQELLAFDCVIIANMPANDISYREMQMLKSYVSDFGGGFIMSGSENSFGLGGYYKTPVEDILPLASRYEKEKEQHSLALVLVIDKSGSMEGPSIAMAKQAAKSALELLSPQDKIAVIAFDGQPYIVCDMTGASNTEDVRNAIDSIAADGGTALYPAMQSAKSILETVGTQLKHVIILSDGMSMPGDFEGISSDMASTGMTVSTIAIGEGSHRELMRQIAELGKGRYYETSDIDTIPRIFTKETTEASKSAVKEEPFAPLKINDADFLHGIDFKNSIPPLLAYVKTRIKTSAVPYLITSTGDPLLAGAQYGLGRSISFTSDLGEQWAGPWLEWRSYGKFWSQIIRSIMKNSSSGGISAVLSDDGNNVSLRIRAQKNSSLEDDPELEVNIESEGVSKKVQLKRSGAETYEGHFKKNSATDSIIRITDKANRQIKTINISEPYPKEYMLFSKMSEFYSSLPRWNESGIRESSGGILRHNARNAFIALAILLSLAAIFFRRQSLF